LKLQILGCSGDVTGNRRTTAYLVNDRVLFDAGAVTDALSTGELKQISHVFLSHSHLDHVKGLCFLSEQVSLNKGWSLTVLADEQVIKALSLHVFNDILWPNFTLSQGKEESFVRLEALDPLGWITAHGLNVKAIAVNHKTPTTGFLVKEGENAIMMTSDTGVTEQFWKVAQLEEHLAFVIAHVAFPDRLSRLAQRSGHMTPSVLLERIDTHGLHHVTFYVAHVKSEFEDEIRHEMGKMGKENIRLAEEGSILVV